jgi:putative SOS response-associated peptidase YedK
VSGSSCDSAEKGGDNAARSYAKPYPPEQMDAHDVSPIVNSAKYDGSECIQPVSDDETPSPGQLSLL